MHVIKNALHTNVKFCNRFKHCLKLTTVFSEQLSSRHFIYCQINFRLRSWINSCQDTAKNWLRFKTCTKFSEEFKRVRVKSAELCWAYRLLVASKIDGVLSWKAETNHCRQHYQWTKHYKSFWSFCQTVVCLEAATILKFRGSGSYQKVEILPEFRTGLQINTLEYQTKHEDKSVKETVSGNQSLHAWTSYFGIKNNGAGDNRTTSLHIWHLDVGVRKMVPCDRLRWAFSDCPQISNNCLNISPFLIGPLRTMWPFKLLGTRSGPDSLVNKKTWSGIKALKTITFLN